jgi:hypothetical protein
MAINSPNILISGLSKFDFMKSFLDKKEIFLEEQEGNDSSTIKNIGVEIIAANRINNSINNWKLQLDVLTDNSAEIKRKKIYTVDYSAITGIAIVKLIKL